MTSRITTNNRIQMDEKKQVDAFADMNELEGKTLAESMEENIKIPERFFCKHCERLQPYRTKHCHVCQACVAKFDHHCFWIGGCVGELNHRKFYYMLLVMTIEFVIGTIYVDLCLLTSLGTGGLTIQKNIRTTHPLNHTTV